MGILRRLAIVLLAVSAFGQQARFDSQALGPKGPIPNVIVSLCSSTATGIPCSPQVTSTTDSGGLTACSLGSPVTPAGSSTCQGTTDALGNFGFWLTPGSYIYSLTGPGITGKSYNLTVPVGINADGSAAISSLTVTGTSTLANVVTGAANSVSTSSVKQVSPTTGLNILDNLGVSHFGISGTSPYTNTFVQGNGAGSVFLGVAAKTNVADTTGNIVTAGSIALQTTSQTLAASIVNDTLGGLLFTTNAGKGWQIANSTGQLQGFAGVNILLQGSSSGGITLAVPAAAGSNTLTFPAATGTLSCNSCAQTLSATTLSSPVIASPTVNTGVSQGSGFKHQRFGSLCTTAASAGTSCITAVTWTSAFADANYTVSCTGVTASNAPVLTIESIAAAGFTIRIFAIVAAAASFATADCIAAHD